MEIREKADRKEEIAYFLAFCIESYRAAHDLDGAYAARVLDASGALEFLEKNYETLHTQSHKWIVQELDDYMASREPEKNNAD